jgi:8-oxo-dGTP pyrophosphatase MutT (NUDIX family)
MYKVFFNDRKLILTDDFIKHFQVNYGLFYKYRDIDDLKELIRFYTQLSRIDTLFLFARDIDELRDAFKKCFIPIVAAGGLVKNGKGEFLLIHRRGKWDLPKGKLGRKELVEEAAIREVEEECGIKGVKLIKPLIATYHTYFLGKEMALKRTSWYEMLYKGSSKPVPQLEEDIDTVTWVPANRLGNYLKECFPAIRDVFTYYGLG